LYVFRFPGVDRVAARSSLRVRIFKEQRPGSFMVRAYRKVAEDDYPVGKPQVLRTTLDPVVRGGKTVAWDARFRVSQPSRDYYSSTSSQPSAPTKALCSSSRSSTEKSPLTIIPPPAGWPANIGQYEDAPGSPLGGVGRQYRPSVGGLYGLPHLEVPVRCRPRRFSRLVEDLCPLGYREGALLPSPLVEVTARVLDHAPVPPAGLLFHEDRAVPLLREVASDTALILCLSSWNIRSLCHNRYRQDQGDYQCCREH
jgi:hypothetical protein